MYDKETKTIALNKQRQATGIHRCRRPPASATASGEVPARPKAVLTPEQIQALVETATRVVERFKGHVDIEWAIEAGILYLLQVRPITRSKEAKPYALWTRDNVADVIPDAVTP